MVEEVIRQNLNQEVEFDVASNPEFLREGAAVKDFLKPDRIVVGVSSDRAAKVLTEMYRPLIKTGAQLLVTDIKSAELIKYASNAFLATKISFINEIADLCEKVGADVRAVAYGMGLDSRIGDKFLEPGPGYGGSCFPKDVDGLINTALDHHVNLRILESVTDVNRQHRVRSVHKLRDQLGILVGRKIAVWGLAFKPNTDDIRESAAVEVIKKLLQEGATVSCYDPIAHENGRRMFTNGGVTFVKDKFDALKDAEALIVMTHWEEFKSVEPHHIKPHLKGNLIIDTRNIWQREDFEAHDFDYHGMGR